MTAIARVYQDEQLTLYHGAAVDWPGDEAIDLVLTNPYGPMPAALRKTPMVIHQWAHRKHEAERWAGLAMGELQLVATWNDGRECFWCANVDPVEVELAAFRPEPGGWYPLEVPLRLLDAYAAPGITIWDGFMGRGTVGWAARANGFRYVGVEQLAAHVALAADYLNLRGVDVAH